MNLESLQVTTTTTTTSPDNPNNSNNGLSFSNGVFTALISDASTWNIDAKISDVCRELRVYPPASMLESRKVSEEGPIYDTSGEKDREFRVDAGIGIRQTNKIPGYSSMDFDRVSNTWPIRMTNWPKRTDDDAVIMANFEFYDPVGAFPSIDGSEPKVGSAKYSNPTRGEERICRVTSGADSDCKLRRINNENKGADGSTIGGTA